MARIGEIMERNVTIKIPESQKPTFKVTVNGIDYEYPAGIETEVPESVASVIVNIYENTPKPLPIEDDDKESVIEPLTVTENGEYTAPDGVDGFSPVNVNVQSGGDTELVDKVLTLEGNCKYRFAYGGLEWLVNEYGDRMKIGTVTDLEYFLAYSNIAELPFDLNITLNGESSSYAFAHSKLVKAPYVRGSLPSTIPSSIDISGIFYSCTKIKEIPYDFFDVLLSCVEGTNVGFGKHNKIFFNANSLLTLPNLSFFHTWQNQTSTSSYSLYNGCFADCYVLHEITDLPVVKPTYNSNSFTDCFKDCGRVKSITFKTNDDGTPCTASWKSQTIKLTSNVGYRAVTSLADYGFDNSTRVTDDETYQALKNDADWWTPNVKYSRYNHDSAVATINSLPDTSAYLAENGGTNTIKFAGQSGELTDGGAINTLTEEEIAVATAKGWTVTFA